MQHIASPTLSWSAAHQVYELSAGKLCEQRHLTIEDDDYHVITADSIHRGMVYLVEHLPPQLHLILATRADPPLPLARLRAQGQLCEVRAVQLRFGTVEVSTFLQTVMGLDLEASDIATLESHTEGWIAGLQLAALSLQGRTDISGFLAAFTGSHRYVLDYLSDEVLARQSASVQTFLLHTSILDRLSGPLCDAVTGHASRSRPQEPSLRTSRSHASLSSWQQAH
jgi:LuxR family transcriptional regulator, maltose regulon positive regulatory protein